MRRKLIAWLGLVGIMAGCATPTRSRLPIRKPIYPAEALITQRAVLSVHGRQFTLNGYLARSETRGLRLIVSETYGGVLADVLVKPDGTLKVMRSSRAFHPEWIQRYIAADVKCVFGNEPSEDCPVQMLSPTHFEIKRGLYRLDLRTLEVRPGLQPAELFEAQ